MEPPLRGFDGAGSVGAIPHADVHRVEPLSLKKRLRAPIGAGDAELLRHGLRAVEVQVRDRDELHVVPRRIDRQVRVLRDVARA